MVSGSRQRDVLGKTVLGFEETALQSSGRGKQRDVQVKPANV